MIFSTICAAYSEDQSLKVTIQLQHSIQNALALWHRGHLKVRLRTIRDYGNPGCFCSQMQADSCAG
eukprot:1161947-Pelagomonas_calceolata.AAC.6